MYGWPIGKKPLGITFARLRPFGSFPNATFSEAGLAWGDVPRRVGLRTVFAYEFPPGMDRRLEVSFGEPDPVAGRAAFRWRDHQDRSVRHAVPFADLERMERRTRVPWVALRGVAVQHGFPHQDLTPLEHRAAFYYRLPPRRERSTAIPWGDTTPRSVRAASPWLMPPRRPRTYTFPWGEATPPGPGVRARPVTPPAPPPVPDPVYQPPPGDQVGLALLCRAYDGPGDQVPLRLARLPCPGLHRRAFSVQNEIYFKRVADDVEIHAEQLTLAWDIESYTHRIQAVLIGADALDLVHDNASAVEVEAGVNGYVWRGYVEGWRRAHEFGDRAITIDGRGLAAELDAPYAQAAARFELDTLTARQIIEDELGVSTWTATPHDQFVDWSVPGTTFDYRDLTPIQAIHRVVEAVGARAIGRKASRDLLLIPRYPYSPWNWDTAPIDVQITEATVVSDSGEWAPSPLRRGIYVAGETDQGVQVGVRRSGSDGAPWLPQVTDPLITSVAAGRERGRNEIAATGNRRIVTRTMPILTGEDEPGLVEPGQLAEVSDSDETWRGLVTSTNVQAQWTNDGLVVWQRIDLERYDDA